MDDISRELCRLDTALAAGHVDDESRERIVAEARRGMRLVRVTGIIPRRLATRLPLVLDHRP
jgi:hypothetical protein